MKKNITSILCFSLLLIGSNYSIAQCTINANAVAGITLVGPGMTNTPMAVVYNPNFDLYYSVGGGNTSMTLVTFDNTGTQVSVASNTGFDHRGMWWNPALNQLETNGYNTSGVRNLDLAGNGYGLNTGTAIFAANQPNVQSMGKLDYDDNEIIYYSAGRIYRKDRVTNASISDYLITGLPVATGNLSTYFVGYTGCAGMEIAVYDYILKAVYLIDKSTGAYVGTSLLPASAPTISSWDSSFSNGQMFIESANQWYGYYIFEQCQALATSVSATDMCDGELVTLSATSTGTGVVTWDNGVVDNVAFASPIGTTTYTATSTDINECVFIVNVTVNPMPTVDAGADITLCAGLTDTTLTAIGTADTFTWDNGVTDGIQFTPTPGITTYIVTAEYTASGCQLTDTLVLMAGNPSITLSASDELFGNDGSATLTILDGIPPFTFDWDNDGTGDNDDSNDLFGIAGGTYTVIMTDATGCTTTETITIGSQLGIDELDIDFSVYPNPTNEEFYISSITNPVIVNIYSVDGKVIINNLTVSNSDQAIKIGNVESGAYFVEVSNDSKTDIIRLLVK